MPFHRLMPRRRFLITAAALTAASSRSFAQAASLGQLAYVDRQSLWLRDLPDGTPRTLATGRQILWPRFSPSGRWIAFQDGEMVGLISADGKPAKQWNAPGSTRIGPSFHWIAGDELVVASENGESNVFSPADNWQASQRSMAPESSLRIAAGTTQSGDWRLYWMADTPSASIMADGLDLYAARTNGGPSHKLGLKTLVYPDFIASSPTQEIVAVTSGFGRETWTGKAIALVDLTGNSPTVKVLTAPSTSAQLPAWSPDGTHLAWCFGPDADVATQQQLRNQGQTSVRAIDPSGAPKEIPIAASSRLGASHDVEQQCVRSRRIWIAEISTPQRTTQLTHAAQLTNDPRYSDEAPCWSRDRGSILFCRTDRGARTLWLMRPDGSQQRQIAGPLRPPPDLSALEKLRYAPYYGYTDWRSLFDWRQS